MRRITEHPVSDENVRLIKSCATQAACVLSVDIEHNTPTQVLGEVDKCIYNLQHGKHTELVEGEDPPFLLGSLWGEMLCRELGWKWAQVIFHDHDDSEAVGVFSPNRSLAIYPFHFIYGCLENEAPVTIELAFNMLADGAKVPDLPPNGYENVMDNVHHVVPRD